ncbi:MAG: DUF3224 domain-containing protein [Polyangiales bacterium]
MPQWKRALAALVANCSCRQWRHKNEHSIRAFCKIDHSTGAAYRLGTCVMQCRFGRWVLLLGALILASSSLVARADKVRGGGPTTVTSTVVTATRTEGDKTILTLKVLAEVEGILDGSIDSDETAVIYPDGSIDLEALQTFTGTANGVEGTLLIREYAHFDEDGELCYSRFHIVDAGGGLAGVHGHGRIEITDGAGTYEIVLHEPDKGCHKPKR